MASIALTASPSSSLAASVAVALGTSVALSISPSSSLAAAAELEVSTRADLSLSPSSRLAAAVGLAVVDSVVLTAGPLSSLNAQFTLFVATGQSLQSAPSSSLSAALNLAVASTVNLSAAPSSYLTASLALTGITNSMTLRDLVEDVLGMWGILSRCSAPDFAIERAINDINAALQLVWNNADERDYWSKSSVTLTLADGESSASLADDIQNVVGPCRLADTRRPLAPLDSIGDLETFSDLFLDGETSDAPVAYHIERLNQAGADPAKCVFHVTPAVVGDSVSFQLEVVKEAPRFNAVDLAEDPIVPIPHRYVETLLLPIARKQASSFYLFRQPEKLESIEAEYLKAQISLGLADPLPGKPAANKEVAK